MKNGLILQRDIHVKVMNKLIPKFNLDFNKSYIDSKVKVKRVRKYLTPMEEFIIYEVDIVVSDLVFNNNGIKPTHTEFDYYSKKYYNRSLRYRMSDKIVPLLNMIDSMAYDVKISKIEYNL